jgi:formiminotetrahydrofolate cyclodeaminase
MRDQPIGAWLAALASSEPAPGGGAVAALNAAFGAALIEMACNLTIGRPRYAQHEAEMRAVLAEATKLQNRALHLAADDAKAFSGVSEAYKLAKETDEQRQTRTEQIRQAMVGATEVPLNTAIVAGEIIRLARRIVHVANANVLADIAAATISARAALETALINVEANLATISDPSRAKEFSERLSDLSRLTGEAERAVHDIRSRMSGRASSNDV